MLNIPETPTKDFTYELCGKTLHDPYQWLESMDSEEVHDWVTKQNTCFKEWVKTTPGYDDDVDRVTKVLERDEKIPFLQMHNGYVYHLHRNKNHNFGLWRRIRIQDYIKSGVNASWEKLLDLDQFNREQGDTSWSWSKFDMCDSDPDRAILLLSDAGKDAVWAREFDLVKKEFMDPASGGMEVPLSKSESCWGESRDVMYSTVTLDEKEKSESGYSLVVRRIERNKKIPEDCIFRAGSDSVAVYPICERGDTYSYMYLIEMKTFFELRHHVSVAGEGLNKKSFKTLPLGKLDNFIGIYHDFLIFIKQEGEDRDILFSVYLPDFIEKGEFSPRKLFRKVILDRLNGTSLSKDSLYLIALENAMPALIQLKLEINGKHLESVEIRHDNVEGGVFSLITSSRQDSEVLLRAEGFLLPPAIYFNDKGDMKKVQGVEPQFDTSMFTVESSEAEAPDGTKIPLQIVRKKDMTLDGSNPTLLYGYGGFDVSMTPSYSDTLGICWLEKGGVYVMANIRGGGEFGRDWHEAGRKEKRLTVFNDFISSAETLIQKGITSPEKLAIMGGSNGGLLVGACMTLRPDLFRAVVCQVPLLDMFRYVFLPPGASWIDEYGDPRNMPDFEWISGYNPYTNVHDDVIYPHVLFATSSADDRVHPGHARKMTALMQSKNLQSHIFLHETAEGGHSMVNKLSDVAQKFVSKFSFLRNVMF